MEVVVKDRETPKRILRWCRQDGVRDRDAKKVICAAGVDAKQATYVLELLLQPKEARIEYSRQLANCLEKLARAKKMGGDMHIGMTNKKTGDRMLIYWRLANWIYLAMSCEDDVLIALKVQEIRDYLGGKDTGLIIR
jgi:hypothetical protein